MAASRGAFLDAAGVLRQVIKDGGLSMTTPLAAESTPAIRTLIQPDGNVVVTLRADAIRQPGFDDAWKAHWAAVQESVAIVPRATAWLRSAGNVLATLGAIGAAVLAALKSREALVALAVGVLSFVAGRAGSAVLRAAVRFGIGKLAGVGVKALSK